MRGPHLQHIVASAAPLTKSYTSSACTQSYSTTILQASTPHTLNHPCWWKPKSPLRTLLADVGAAHHAVQAASADVLVAWAEETPVAAAAAATAAAAGTESAEPPKKTKTDRKTKWFVR